MNDRVDGEVWPQRLLLAAAMLGLLLALLTGGVSDRQRLSEAGAIARVNDRPSDRTEFASAYHALLADKSKAPTEADKRLVLDRLIEEELLVQRGREIGLLEGDASVRKTIAMAVIEFVLAQSGSDAVSEPNLRQFYNENKARFAPASRMQIAQIFVPYNETDEAAVTTRLDEIRTALRSGVAFGDVEARFGTPIVPALPRVLLTPAKMKEYLGPQLSDAAARLPQGAISDALAGPTGWHFLKIIRNRPGRAPAYETIRPQIIDAVRRSRDDTALRDYLDWLKKRADISLAPDAPQ